MKVHIHKGADCNSPPTPSSYPSLLLPFPFLSLLPFFCLLSFLTANTMFPFRRQCTLRGIKIIFLQPNGAKLNRTLLTASSIEESPSMHSSGQTRGTARLCDCMRGWLLHRPSPAPGGGLETPKVLNPKQLLLTGLILVIPCFAFFWHSCVQ